MYCIIIFLILLLDQISKHLARGNLKIGQTTPIIKNFFHLTLVFNTGAAFGMFRNNTLFFILTACVAIIVISINLKFKIFYSNEFNLQNLSLILILAGAVGNLIDRIRFGYVVDFLDFRIWPVFNIADSAITIGAILLVISIFRESRKK